LVEEVPAALDRLVMSMLSQDPEARPASAAEVMDRLGAIANLAPAEDLGVAAAYLAKPALVGRERERTRIRDYLKREDDPRRRGPLVIEGAEGVGKTRMLEELVLEAKVAGWVTLGPRKSARDEPYALLRELIEELVACAPDIVQQVDAEDRALLARRFPQFGATTAVAQMLSLGELRIRLHAALARCFVQASKSQRLCIVADDFARADDESVALLATLAGEMGAPQLRLAFALPLAQPDDPPAMRIVRARGIPLRLRRLGSADVAQLIDSLFGAAPNSGRVAHWMYEQTHGNPLECIELAHYLIARGLIQYTEGSWMLPPDLPRESPQGLEQTRKARVAALAEDQRRIAEATAILAVPIAVELCALMTGFTEPETVRGLANLVELELLREQSGDYVFRSDAVRAEVEAGLTAERAQLLHERAGQLLLQQPELYFHTKLRAAHHLMRGSSRRHGADLVAGLAKDPAVARDVSEAFTAPLELALSIYREQNVAPCETIPLLVRLMNAAFLYDRNLVRYSADLLPQLWHDCGLDLLPEIDQSRSDWLETLRARAEERYRDTPVAQRGMPPSEAIPALSGISVLVLAGAILKWNIGLIEQAWQAVEPFARLGSGTPLAAPPELVGIALRGVQVGESAYHEQRVAYLERLRDPTCYPGFPEPRRLSILATQYHNIGMATSVFDGEMSLRLADDIDAFGLEMYRGAALQVRFMVYMYRGELDHAEQCRTKLDILALQGGAGTQFELWMAPYLADPYALWDDVLGLKQAASHLSRLAAQEPGYLPFACIATGHYCRVRGDFPKALEAFEKARELAPRNRHAGWLLALSGHVDTLVEAGRYQEAFELGNELLGTLDYPERFNAIIEHRMARSMTLAQAHTGHIPEGIERAQHALELELALGKSPLHLGRLHEALARIAVLQRDGAGFSHHLLQLREYFGATRNPTLIKRSDRLASLGRSQFPAANLIASEDDLYAHNVILTLTDLNLPKQRAARALEMILRELEAEDGFLYLVQGSELELAASTADRPPPIGLQTILSTQMSEMFAGDDLTVTLPRAQAAMHTTTIRCDQQEFAPLHLLLTVEGERRIVGVVAVPLTSTTSLRVPESRLLNAITASLYLAAPSTSDDT
jgi:tetratricopeptide (TPR) repeat protein